jgi:hypothetical protein
MKSYLLPLSLLVMLASCTTAYKTGQTPDDVYFSPARPVDEYVRTENNDDRKYRAEEEEREAREDRYIRMRVRNRRWSTIDDGSYYSYHPAYSPIIVNSPWNAYSYWNYAYNPYCCCNNQVILPSRASTYSKPRMVNMNVFNTPPVTNGNVKGKNSYRNSSNTSGDNNNYRNSGQSAGGFLRDVLGGGSSSSGSKSSGSSSSGSGSSSSGGSSSGSRAPVRKG